VVTFGLIYIQKNVINMILNNKQNLKFLMLFKSLRH